MAVLQTVQPLSLNQWLSSILLLLYVPYYSLRAVNDDSNQTTKKKTGKEVGMVFLRSDIFCYFICTFVVVVFFSFLRLFACCCCCCCCCCLCSLLFFSLKRIRCVVSDGENNIPSCLSLRLKLSRSMSDCTDTDVHLLNGLFDLSHDHLVLNWWPLAKLDSVKIYRDMEFARVVVSDSLSEVYNYSGL